MHQSFSNSLVLSFVLAWTALTPFAVESKDLAAEDQALLQAMGGDDEQLVAQLIGNRVGVNYRDEMGTTPLMWAAQHVNLNLVTRLLKTGADPNIHNDAGLGPLQIAIANHAGDIASLLLRSGADARVARDDDGETALMTAARTGQLDIMRQLVAHGARVNAKERQFGQTALMWSAGYPEQVKFLIQHGADVRARTRGWNVTNPIYTGERFGHLLPWADDGEYISKEGGQAALFFAVEKDDLASVKALLDAGADVNDHAADGSTALLLALYKWDDGGPNGLTEDPAETEGKVYGLPYFKPDLSIAEFLLDRGASPSVSNTEGDTPLHGAALGLVPVARPVPRPFVAAAPVTPVDGHEAIALVVRLLDLGASANAVTRYPTPGPIGAVRISGVAQGSTPLHIAAVSGNTDLMNALLARGGDPNRLRKDGHSPLSLAVIANDLPMVTALVEHGADVERLYDPDDLILVDGSRTVDQPRRQQTILHIAAAAGADHVIAFLANHGARIDLENDHGETPLKLADTQEVSRYRGAKELYERNILLARAGADTDPMPVRDSKTSKAIEEVLRSKMAANSQRGGSGGPQVILGKP